MNKPLMNPLLLACLLSGAGTVAARAADVSLTGNDPLGSSSFNTAGTWDNAAAPSAGNNYFTGNFRLRTPADGNSYVFGGDSLTANHSPAGDASLGIGFKGIGTTGILTANWVLDGGEMFNIQDTGSYFQMAGTLSITPNGGRLWAKQGEIIVHAPITGTGPLMIPATDAPAETTRRFVTLVGNNTGFTGKISLIGKLSINTEENLGGNPAGFAPDQLSFDGGILITTNTFAINDANRGFNLSGAGGAISVLNPDTNNVANLTVASPITGFGTLTKTGNGTLTLSGANDFGGTFVLAEGRLNVNSTTAFGSSVVTFNSGAAVLDNTSGLPLTLVNNNVQTWNGGLTFLGSSALDLGAGSVSINANATVTVSNLSLTVGSVFDDGNLRALTKQGPGSLVMAGGYYGGNTFVNEGVLALVNNSVLGSPLITIASNATLDVSSVGGYTLVFGQTLTSAGTITGNLSDGSGSTTINPGIGIGTLTVNGNLTLGGSGTVNYQLGSTTTPGGGINDLIAVSGQLNLAAPTTLNIIGTPATGTYTLFQYGSFAGSLANLTVAPGFSLNNNVAAKTIELVVTHAPAALTWQGDGIGNVWDLGTTANWIQNGTNTFFFTGDTVTFNNSGSSVPAINLAGDLSPAGVIVDASQNYTFTGGSILTGSLTKNGSGALVLDNTNSYSGPTAINAGILQLGDPAGPKAGTAGTFGRGPVTNNSVVIFNRTDTLIITNSISGSGSVTNQLGSTVLSGSNSFNGPVTIKAGTIQVNNASALGSTNGATVVEGTGQLNAFNRQTIFENVILNPTDTTTHALRNGGNNIFAINGTIALNSSAAVQVDTGSTMIFSNQVSGVGGLIKNVGGNLILVGSNSFAGGIVVNTGTLTLGNNAALGNSQVTVNSTTGGAGLSGTRLTLSGGVAIPALKTLSLPGADRHHG
jgi:fibronectin-binding autotransporter adhesin